MGVKGLGSFLWTKARKAFIDHNNILPFAGTKFAIDVPLFSFHYAKLKQVEGSKYSVPELFLQQYEHLKRNNVEPIFVFDGKTPKAKKVEVQVRAEKKNENAKEAKKLDEIREVKEKTLAKIEEQVKIQKKEKAPKKQIQENLMKIAEIKKEIKENKKESDNKKRQAVKLPERTFKSVKEAFQVCKVPFIQAVGEAEKACAFLIRKGLADVAMTEDMDALAFGATRLLRNYRSNTRCLQEVRLDIMLEQLGLSHEAFIEFCILCGCDYTPTLPLVTSPQIAYDHIKRYGSIDTLLAENAEFRDAYEKYNSEMLEAQALAAQAVAQVQPSAAAAITAADGTIVGVDPEAAAVIAATTAAMLPTPTTPVEAAVKRIFDYQLARKEFLDQRSQIKNAFHIDEKLIPAETLKQYATALLHQQKAEKHKQKAEQKKQRYNQNMDKRSQQQQQQQQKQQQKEQQQQQQPQ